MSPVPRPSAVRRPMSAVVQHLCTALRTHALLDNPPADLADALCAALCAATVDAHRAPEETLLCPVVAAVAYDDTTIQIRCADTDALLATIQADTGEWVHEAAVDQWVPEA